MNVRNYSYTSYLTAGFVCKGLICMNYASCCGLTDFNSTVMLIPWFQLSHCCMCHNLVSCNLIYASLQVNQESGHFCFAAVLDPKGFSALIASWQQYDISWTVTQPNILVHMVSPDHTAYCKEFSFKCNCTCRTQWFLKRSHDLTVTRVAEILNNCRCYCWAKIDALQKLDLVHYTY